MSLIKLKLELISLILYHVESALNHLSVSRQNVEHIVFSDSRYANRASWKLLFPLYHERVIIVEIFSKQCGVKLMLAIFKFVHISYL